MCEGVMHLRPVILAGILLALAACSNKTPDLKSPCVGATDSPCDRRAPAEQHG